MKLKELIPGIKEIYLDILQITVYISSFIFFCLALAFFVFGLESFIYVLSGFAIVTILLSQFKKFKYVKKVRQYFGEIIAILGSIFVLFLFVNSYLKISVSLNQLFLDIWEEAELSLNQYVITVVVIFASASIYVYIILKLLSFLANRMKLKSRDLGAITIFFLFLIFLAEAIFEAILETEGFPSSWSDFLYPKLNWILGFSLIFLHLNYLVKEAKKFFKQSLT